METAMESLSSKFEFRIRWEPYFLRSNLPPEGAPMPEQYRDPNNPRIQHMRELASSLGLHFNTNRTRFPNTMMGHALLEMAKQDKDVGLQDRVSEALFKRCFSDCEDLQLDSCLGVARECGLDEGKVKAYITDPSNQQAVLDKAKSWSEKGISGVPTYYFNGQKMFSGAQDVDAFKRMFEIAAEKFPVEAASKS